MSKILVDKDVLTQALKALEHCVSTCFDRYSHEQVMSRPEHFVNQCIIALNASLTEPMNEPHTKWDDSLVQRVYEILCDDALPPNKEEHWEGWVARRIVDSLTESVQEPVAWGCFRDNKLLDDLVGTEADVDYWVASEEKEMQGMIKRPLYTAPKEMVEYDRHNPLGGPAVVFEAIASRLRAGEEYNSVLSDYNLQHISKESTQITDTDCHLQGICQRSGYCIK